MLKEHPVHKGYWVAPSGRVWSERASKWVGSPSTKYGHVKVAKRGWVHVMVLETFVGPRPDGCLTRHLNGDASDNRVGNLAWGTVGENTSDRIAHGTQTHGATAGGKFDEAEVRDIRSRAKRGNYLALAREFAVSGRAIRDVAIGRTYRWVA